MDVSVIVAIISGIGVVVSALVGFMGNKKGTLANAEKEFRATIMDDNKVLRDRVENLESKLSEVMLENNRIKVKLIRIQERYDISDEVLEESV